MKSLWILLSAVLLGILLSGSVGAVTCTSCSDCSQTIASANSGDTVQLTTSISNYTGTSDTGCISFGGKDG